MTTTTPHDLLSRTECGVLRGLAILGIVLHNYCHWLGPIVKENEYQFFRMNADAFAHVLLHPDATLPLHLLSFFGHYGVPVFLFLSAYGLVRKYEAAPPPPAGAFVRRHFLKLFRMMVVGFVAFTMVDAITPGPHRYRLLDIVAQLGLFNNLLPHPDKVIWPGPYWFFGLMLQLYIVYRLLLYRRFRATVGLIVLCLAVQLLLSPEGEALNRYRYNFMGGMLPFGLGLLYARHGHLLQRRRALTEGQWHALAATASAAFILVGSFSFWLWSLVPAFVCTFCVALVKLVGRAGWLMRPLGWLGGISAALFVCHPITRKVFIPVSRQGDLYAGLLLYVVASLCLACLFRRIMDGKGSKKSEESRKRMAAGKERKAESGERKPAGGERKAAGRSRKPLHRSGLDEGGKRKAQG